MDLADFHYDLPSELIASRPARERTDSRLLVVPDAQTLHDARFGELGAWLQPGDLLVMNDTRVIAARLRAHKPTGGAVEVLLERIVDERHALAHLKASKTPRPDTPLRTACHSGWTRSRIMC